MGKLENLSIAFSTQPPVYFPGQLVSGTVNVTLNDDMKMRNLRVKFQGKAKVSWKESHGSGANKSIDYYSNEEEYFSHKIVLWGNPEGSEDEAPTMPKGTYSFPFEFGLPYNIAASFEGEVDFDGYVRYSVKATIDKPWKFDHETKVAFTVASFLDLNTPEIMEPAHASEHKYHCCWCCKSGPITGTVHIPGRMGFVPGEKIPVEGEISNKSNVKINGWKVKLCQVVNYTAYHSGFSKTKTEEKTIAKYESNEEIRAGDDKNISCQIEVPPLPPSELEHCDFIVIDYFIVLTVKPDRSVDLDVPAFVIIGNIPLRSEWSQVSPPAVAPIMALAPAYGSDGPDGSLPYPSGARGSSLPYPASPFALPPSLPPLQPTAPTVVAPYPDMPPPSYNECFGVGANLKEDEDDANMRAEAFKPLYPTFTWN